MTESNQHTARSQAMVRLRRFGRLLEVALESRFSGRLFAFGMVAGSIFALATTTPPYVPLICLVVWPLLSAIICGTYLMISVLELRLLSCLGLSAGLVLHLLFVVTMSSGIVLLIYPDSWLPQ